MPMLRSDEKARDAVLRGAATIFDLSGSGVFPPPDLGSLDSDLEALRSDFAAIGQDFFSVLYEELERLRSDEDGGQP